MGPAPREVKVPPPSGPPGGTFRGLSFLAKSRRGSSVECSLSASTGRTSRWGRDPMHPSLRRIDWCLMPGETLPLVSCIMPTADRRAFASRAIAHFLRQDYTSLELVIVDDGRDWIADIVPDDPRIRYVPLQGRVTVGAKRNLACQVARGDILLHWDDDDWMSADRVTRQVCALRGSGADVCGSSRLFLYAPSTREAWEYVYPRGARPWVAGETLCYTRALWRRNPFPHVVEGEDSEFLWSAEPKTIHDMNDLDLCVAAVHPRNTSPKRTASECYRPVPFASLVSRFVIREL